MHAVQDHRNAERALPPIGFRYIHPPDRQSAPGSPGPVRPVSQPGPVRRGQRDLPVYARGPASSVALRHLPHAEQRIRPAPQHQFLQEPDLGPVPGLRRLEDPLPNPPYVLYGTASQRNPSRGDRPPVRSLRGPPSPARTRVPSSCLTCPSVPAAVTVRLQRLTRSTSAPFRVRARCPVSGQLSRAAAGERDHTAPVSRHLSARRDLLPGRSCSRRGVQRPSRSACRPR